MKTQKRTPERFKKGYLNHSGQALLLVLLGLAVVLTIVLSIAARSNTDVDLSFRDEEYMRAFSAAEAGVEQALIANIGESVEIPFDQSNSVVTGTIAGLAQNQTFYNLPDKFPSGTVGTVWFVSRSDDGVGLTCTDKPCFTGNQMRVCWADPGTYTSTTAPAIELSLYYDTRVGNADKVTSYPNPTNYSGLRVVRGAYDRYATTRGNEFTAIDTTTCSVGSEADTRNYQYRTALLDLSTLGVTCNMTTPGCLIFARVRMLYNPVSQPIGVIVNSALPAQGRDAEMQGSSGDATVDFDVQQTFREPLDIFESAIFSGGNLVKNN